MAVKNSERVHESLRLLLKKPEILSAWGLRRHVFANDASANGRLL